MPQQLDDATRQALCAGDQPPPGAEDRVLAALLGPLAGPPGGGGSGGGSGLGPSSWAYAVKVVSTTLAMTAGGLVLLAGSAAGLRGLGDGSKRSSMHERAAVVASADPSGEHEPEPEPELASATTDLEPATTAEGSATGLGSAPSAPATGATPLAKPGKLGSTPAAKPTPEAASGVEAELALMKLARAATDPKAALLALERHRVEFGAGVFAAEREVLRAEQLCALGRRTEAEAVVSAFLTRDPSNPLRSRIERACPKP